MKEKGIILDDARVRLLRSGASEIIMLMREQPSWDDGKEPPHIEVNAGGFMDSEGVEFPSPVGDPGDGLWIREAYGQAPDGSLRYRADHPGDQETIFHSPVRMGRDKSRLRFIVDSVLAMPLHAALERLTRQTGRKVDIDLQPLETLAPDAWVWVVGVRPVDSEAAAPPPEPPANVEQVEPLPALDLTPGPYRVVHSAHLQVHHASMYFVVGGNLDAYHNPTRENAADPLLMAALEHGTFADARLLASSWDMLVALRELVALKDAKARGFTGEITEEAYHQRKEDAWERARVLLAANLGLKGASNATED